MAERTGEETGTLGEEQVDAMFDRIASRYDRMNTLLTAGLHARWRRAAALRAGLASGDRALDVATGTGDFAFALTRHTGRTGKVVGVDRSKNMLEIAEEKARARRLSDRVEFLQASALELPFSSETFRAVTIGFGARNFQDLAVGLREAARVLEPGGRLVILEAAGGNDGLLSHAAQSVFSRVAPALGALTGERSAYTYLPQSTRRYPPPKRVAEVLREVGFKNVAISSFAFGLVSLHVAEK